MVARASWWAPGFRPHPSLITCSAPGVSLMGRLTPVINLHKTMYVAACHLLELPNGRGERGLAGRTLNLTVTSTENLRNLMIHLRNVLQFVFYLLLQGQVF